MGRLYRRAVRDYRPQSAKSSFERALQAFAQTRFGGRLFLSVFPAIDRRLIPVTRGRLSTGLGQPQQVLLVAGQVLVGQAEGEFHPAFQPAVVVAFVEPVGVIRECPAWCATDVPGDQAQGQR